MQVETQTEAQVDTQADGAQDTGSVDDAMEFLRGQGFLGTPDEVEFGEEARGDDAADTEETQAADTEETPSTPDADSEEPSPEVQKLSAKVEKLEADDARWKRAATHMIHQQKALQSEVAQLRAMLAEAGVELDPRDDEIALLRQRQEAAELDEQIAQQQAEAQREKQARAYVEKRVGEYTEKIVGDFEAFAAKNPELQDPDVRASFGKQCVRMLEANPDADVVEFAQAFLTQHRAAHQAKRNLSAPRMVRPVKSGVVPASRYSTGSVEEAERFLRAQGYIQ